MSNRRENDSCQVKDKLEHALDREDVELSGALPTEHKFVLELAKCFAEVIKDEQKPDAIKALQINALKQLHTQLTFYEQQGYDKRLLLAIAQKKGVMILSTRSKTEMLKLLRPKCPHFDGVKFVPGKYSVPEEEMICWSEISLRTPLGKTASKRYRELFHLLYPNKATELFS